MTPRIGVILLDHGEPPEYNEHTYYSFRDFAHSLIMMGLIPEVVLRAKRGTILMDRSKIFVTEPHPHPDLIDAWLRPHTGPTEFVPARKKILGLIPAPREPITSSRGRARVGMSPISTSSTGSRSTGAGF